MDSPILKEITKFLHERKKQRRNTIIFACMALVVVAGTAATLRMIGQAMTRKEKVLVCALEVHEHDKKDCYDDDKNLICGLADYVVHVHNDDCYDVNGRLACQLPEVEPHEHTDECYEEEEILVCGEEESNGHEHTGDCYETVRGDLSCGMKEHEHDDGCYDEEGELTCDLDEHEHDEDCYDEEETLVCGQKEGDDGHTHTDSCYETEKVLACGKLELHTHDEEKCYEKDEDGNLFLTCTETVLEEHVHSDELGCFEIREAVTEAAVEREYFSEHSETGENPDDVSATESGEEKTFFTTEDDSEEPETENMEEAGDVSATQPEEPQIVKTYAGEGYKVTASYTEEAEIPEEAELIAEQITPESDSEYYAKREAEYKEALGDEEASAKALFKIGFYVNGEEVEPKVPVTITVQFLDENGLPEGTPVTVVHFGDEGSEVLDGGQMTGGATSFKLGSFSDVVIGTGINKNQPLDIETAETGAEYLNLDDTFQYEDEDYHMEFHITGQVRISENDVTPTYPAETEIPVADEEPAGDEASQAGMEGSETAEAAAEENKEGTSQVGTLYTLTMDGSGEDAQGAEEPAAETENGEAGENTETAEDAAPAEPTYQDLKLDVEVLDEDSEEGKALRAHAEEKEAGAELISFRPMKYTLSFQGQALDLSNCTVTMNVKPTEKLEAELQETMAQLEEEATGEEVDPNEGNYPINVSVSQLIAGMVSDVGSADVNGDEGEGLSVVMRSRSMSGLRLMSATPDTSNGPAVFAVRGAGQPNPHFTVQYYANLDVLASTGTNELTMIDTSKEGNGKETAVLPKNKGKVDDPPTDAFKYMYVDETGKVQTVNELTEVYSSRNFEYKKAPSIKYMNALIANLNYELKEVWVLKEKDPNDQNSPEPDSASVDKNDWIIYEKSDSDDSFHFTNRNLGEESNKYIFIKDNAIIRFVYDTTTKENNFSAAFYDYDISTGRVHRAKPPEDPNQYVYKTAGQTFSGNSLTSEVLTWAGGLSGWDGHLYAYTKEQGINSSGNYSGSGTKLAFGNVNTGTNLGRLTWSKDDQNNNLNKYNNQGYQGCTFGLVTKMSDGKIQYASGINAPKLFNEGDATGKTSYDKGEYSLKFNRVGDTYTLSAVNGTDATGLDLFNNPTNHKGTYDGNHYYEGENIGTIWTNNFWPMDSAPSFGTGTHDVKFGGTATFKGREHEIRFGPITQKGSDYTFPESDDGLYHNSYFGMNYEVNFDLVEDYVGPLEYYFFGDDDMWVFLDGQLVCDIGGVHSSVGEYVDLWDYLDKGSKDSKGRHTLSFFYTERGASGSTCWMQFTLPSVSSDTPETSEDDYGHLRIDKSVVEVNNKTEKPIDNGDEFTFNIYFEKDGENLPDDYSYIKYNKDGNEIDADLVLHDGSEFKLKNGEYIIVKFLPLGTRYKITELANAVSKTGKDSSVEYFTDIVSDGRIQKVRPHTHSEACGSECSSLDAYDYHGNKPENYKEAPDYLHNEECNSGDNPCNVVYKDNGRQHDPECGSKCPYVDALNIGDDNRTATGYIHKTQVVIPDGEEFTENQLVDKKAVRVTFKNKYYVYELPKTGGPGTTPYTIACLLCLLGAGSAGFLYRKKFRERRVRRSS